MKEVIADVSQYSRFEGRAGIDEKMAVVAKRRESLIKSKKKLDENLKKWKETHYKEHLALLRNHPGSMGARIWAIKKVELDDIRQRWVDESLEIMAELSEITPKLKHTGKCSLDDRLTAIETDIRAIKERLGL